jgi:hypothetical protein
MLPFLAKFIKTNYFLIHRTCSMHTLLQLLKILFEKKMEQYIISIDCL